MKPFSHVPLLFALSAAGTLACSGCVQPVDGAERATAGSNKVEQTAPHHCRSSVAQTTQKGCRPFSAVARK